MNPRDVRVWYRAKNVDTGAVWEIRPDMLEREPRRWILVDDNDNPIDTSPEVGKPAKSNNEENIILTAEGKPFKTEQAARMAMGRRSLSEDEWIVLDDGKEGFIITKV